MTSHSTLFASTLLIFALTVFAGDLDAKINEVQETNLLFRPDNYPANVYGMAMSRTMVRLGMSGLRRAERIQVWVSPPIAMATA